MSANNEHSATLLKFCYGIFTFTLITFPVFAEDIDKGPALRTLEKKSSDTQEKEINEIPAVFTVEKAEAVAKAPEQADKDAKESKEDDLDFPEAVTEEKSESKNEKDEEATYKKTVEKIKQEDKKEVESKDSEDTVKDEKTAEAAEKVEPAKPAIVLTPPMLKLRDSVRRTLATYERKHLNTRDHNHWEIIHHIVAWGANTKVRIGSPNGKLTNAIIWQCWNKPAKGMSFMRVSGDDLIVAKGPRVQGHQGQFMAVIAQSHISLNSPLKVSGRDFTIADLVESEKRSCRTGTELTFKLIAFSHYLKDTDEVWQNDLGEDWTIEKLLREELGNDVYRTAACGGTHRMMGISYAVKARIRDGKPMTGDYARAAKFLDEFHNYALALQNKDGSFSTQWFRSRQASNDLARRLQTTGHILEWLTYSLEQEELMQPKMVNAVAYLNNIMARNPNKDWSIGPLGHALHALKLYDKLVFKAAEKSAKIDVANKQTK